MRNRAAQTKVDHYGSQYGNFESDILSAIRRDAFGEDIGQTGWTTSDEQDLFISWLRLTAGKRLLDIACGSGRPALRIAQKTGCHVTGVDIHKDGVMNAQRHADHLGLSEASSFICADASTTLPFEDETFNAIICIDAINHLPDRHAVFEEWRRLLKPSGVLVFTDPVVITGPMTNQEMTIRSSIGFFLFVPTGMNERILGDCGFDVDRAMDRTENMANNARRWLKARSQQEKQLRTLEGDDNYHGQQTFFETAHALAAERRLSRFAYMARRA